MLGMGSVTTMFFLIVLVLGATGLLVTLVVNHRLVAVEREKTLQRRLDVEAKSIESSAKVVEAYPLKTFGPDGTAHVLRIGGEGFRPVDP